MNKLALALVTIGAFATGFGCSAGAPGGGDHEVTRSSAGALTSADLSGLVACEVTTDTYADCVVDPAYPVYSGYTVTVTPDDGSPSVDFAVTTKVTGKTTSGTSVRLTGDGFKGVWSWKPEVDKYGSTTLSFYCPPSICGGTVTQVKKPFGPDGVNYYYGH